ncbi:dTDP-4-dehydrorhamnose reductase [Fontimonas sp. SYSU GA230001]|uniref:dTDP-4-dehydrorhamnose reductase n=1 Tax=Fontimonas sp. SYSU GA230001 TaxID=3142450 RepID=UPI0032B42F66
MRSVLVTGCKGQLGIELSRSPPAGTETHGVDLPELDITDATAVMRHLESLRPQVVINCAAYTAVDRAESDADAAFRVNRDGARNLALAATRIGARIVHISTDFVFDGCKSSPYLPDDAPSPLGVYGQSKLEGERGVLDAAASALVVRTAWLYSAHGSNFVKTMLRLMQEKPELRVVADQIGTPTAATSLARALWALLEANAPAGIYHFSDAGAASWYDLACAVRELALPHLAATPAPIVPIRTQDYPTPARRPAYSVLDKTATWALIGNGRHWREPLAEVVNALLAAR